MMIQHEVDLITGTAVDVILSENEEAEVNRMREQTRAKIAERQAENARKAREARLREEALQSILEEAAARPGANAKLREWLGSR